MKRFQVIRTHISPYQGENFYARERAMVEAIPGLQSGIFESFGPVKTILITNTQTQLSKLPPELLKQTELIVHPNSGYDQFTPEIHLLEGIPTVIGHSIRAQAVAEYSIGALFEGLQQIPQHLTWDPTRKWDRRLLKDSPVWVFGYGHIGRIIADTLATLGMKVVVIDPFIKECPHSHHPSWRKGQLSEAKVIISAMSLNQSSQEIFNQDFFSQVSSDLLFINGARGKLVEEKALREFLLSHPEAQAFMDVFQEEPFTTQWHGFPQVWKTSHIAGVDKNLDDKILQFEKNVLTDFLDLDLNSFKWKYQQSLLQNKWINGVLI